MCSGWRSRPAHFKRASEARPQQGGWLFYEESGVKYDMLCGPHSLPQLPHSAATLPKQPEMILNRWAELALRRNFIYKNR